MAKIEGQRIPFSLLVRMEFVMVFVECDLAVPVKMQNAPMVAHSNSASLPGEMLQVFKEVQSQGAIVAVVKI